MPKIPSSNELDRVDKTGLEIAGYNLVVYSKRKN